MSVQCKCEDPGKTGICQGKPVCMLCLGAARPRGAIGDELLRLREENGRLRHLDRLNSYLPGPRDQDGRLTGFRIKLAPPATVQPMVHLDPARREHELRCHDDRNATSAYLNREDPLAGIDPDDV